MIEKFTKEELNTLINELRENGYTVKENRKGAVLIQEAEKLGMNDCCITEPLKKAITEIADWATDNTEDKPSKNGNPPRTYKKPTVSPEIEEEYRRICRGILETIQRHYGKIGFRSRNR